MGARAGRRRQATRREAMRSKSELRFGGYAVCGYGTLDVGRTMARLGAVASRWTSEENAVWQEGHEATSRQAVNERHGDGAGQAVVVTRAERFARSLKPCIGQ